MRKRGESWRVLIVKAEVRHRDGHKCTECGMTQEEHLSRYKKSLEVHRLKPRSVYQVDGCVTLCKACHGPKPRSSFSDRVKIPAALVSKIKGIIAFDNLRISVSKYVDSVIRGPIEEEYKKVIREAFEALD